MAKLTDSQINTIAAILALSNMGQRTDKYAPKDNVLNECIKSLVENPRTSISSAVGCLCQQYIETDEHYSIFMDEAKSFRSSILKNKTAARKNWNEYFGYVGAQ